MDYHVTTEYQVLVVSACCIISSNEEGGSPPLCCTSTMSYEYEQYEILGERTSMCDSDTKSKIKFDSDSDTRMVED